MKTIIKKLIFSLLTLVMISPVFAKHHHHHSNSSSNLRQPNYVDVKCANGKSTTCWCVSGGVPVSEWECNGTVKSFRIDRKYLQDILVNGQSKCQFNSARDANNLIGNSVCNYLR
ncbi:MAG: hypothetical protein OXD32_03525 [Endozoicomonadaceae bacterium]|nr:hypothetical protein [Endozoicomonadaceae bacterium]MCY4329370.1 hypothetical protein [Endozoicomonadaceae bacterium]